MSKRFAMITSKKVKMLLAIIAIPFTCLITWEICVDFIVIGLGGDGGAPHEETGQILIDNWPVTDTEFVSIGVELLQDMDSWWQGYVDLVSATRKLQCSQVHNLSEHDYSLVFRSADRTSLLVEAENRAWLEFNNNRAALSYTLFEFDHSRYRPFDGRDLSKTKLGSLQALELAESNGGAAFRAAVEDVCYVITTLNSSSNGWRVIYHHGVVSDPSNDFICFSINPDSGVEEEVKMRRNTCEFSDS